MKHLSLFLRRVRAEEVSLTGSFPVIGVLYDELSLDSQFPVVVVEERSIPAYIISYLFPGFLASLCERDDRYCYLGYDKRPELSRIAVSAGCKVYVFPFAGAKLGVVDCARALG